MESKTTLQVTKDNLPLTVREHLMRGQQEPAVNELIQVCGLDKTTAEQLIDDYRAALRERKIELDIIMMNNENARDNDEMTRLMVVWGGRIVVILFALVMLYLFFGM